MLLPPWQAALQPMKERAIWAHIALQMFCCKTVSSPRRAHTMVTFAILLLQKSNQWPPWPDFPFLCHICEEKRFLRCFPQTGGWMQGLHALFLWDAMPVCCGTPCPIAVGRHALFLWYAMPIFSGTPCPTVLGRHSLCN